MIIQKKIPVLFHNGANVNHPPAGNVVFMVSKETDTVYATKKGDNTVYVIAKTL